MLRAVILLSALSLPLSATLVQNDIPAVAFDLPLNEGSGTTPAYTGTGGSGNCTSTALSWSAGPPVAANTDDLTTIINCTPTLNLNSSTLSACINPAGWGENAAGYVIQSDSNGTLNGRGIYMAIQDVNDSIGTFVQSGAAAETRTADNSMTVGDSTWKHILLAASGCSPVQNCVATIYVNGVSKTVTATGTATGTKNADTNIRVLNRLDSARTFDGLVHSVRFYESAFNKFQAEWVSLTVNCDAVTPPPAAITQTDCDTLMTSYNAAADQADPFELTGVQHQSVDSCLVQMGVPTR